MLLFSRGCCEIGSCCVPTPHYMLTRVRYQWITFYWDYLVRLHFKILKLFHYIHEKNYAFHEVQLKLPCNLCFLTDYIFK